MIIKSMQSLSALSETKVERFQKYFMRRVVADITIQGHNDNFEKNDNFDWTLHKYGINCISGLAVAQAFVCGIASHALVNAPSKLYHIL